MHVPYMLRAALSLPALPLLYVQGRRLRARIPRLRSARGPSGTIGEENASSLRITFVGESSMAGLGAATHKEAFAGSFSQEIASQLTRRVHWQVFARSGFVTSRITRSLIPRIDPQSDLVVVGTGGNDAFRLRSPRRFRAEIMQLVRTVRDRCGTVPVFFVRLPPIREFPAFSRLMKRTIGRLGELLSDELQEVADSLPDVYFDNRTGTLEELAREQRLGVNFRELFSDGVHPSRLTYQTWARDSVRWLLQDAQCNLNADDRHDLQGRKPADHHLHMGSDAAEAFSCGSV